jgi:hypothetical protein
MAFLIRPTMAMTTPPPTAGSGDLADHAAVLQHVGHVEQLFAKTAAKDPYDRVAGRSKAALFQNCACRFLPKPSLINPMCNRTIVLLILNLQMRRDLSPRGHLGGGRNIPIARATCKEILA